MMVFTLDYQCRLDSEFMTVLFLCEIMEFCGCFFPFKFLAVGHSRYLEFHWATAKVLSRDNGRHNLIVQSAGVLPGEAPSEPSIWSPWLQWKCTGELWRPYTKRCTLSYFRKEANDIYTTLYRCSRVEAHISWWRAKPNHRHRGIDLTIFNDTPGCCERQKRKISAQSSAFQRSSAKNKGTTQ